MALARGITLELRTAAGRTHTPRTSRSGHDGSKDGEGRVAPEVPVNR